MLGPLEDLLTAAKVQNEIDQLNLINRNALRLLKLVNSLLDFAQIEAGRIQAKYRPIDITMATKDLISNFRSACERVGNFFRNFLKIFHNFMDFYKLKPF